MNVLPSDVEARHAARRRAGVPTVSVEVGGDAPSGVDDGVAAEGLAAWLAGAARQLAADAAAGAGLGLRFPELARVPLPAGANGWAERLGAVFDSAEARDGEGWRVVEAVAGAVGAERCPALTLRAGDVGELAAALRFATRLAERRPALAVAVRVRVPAVWEAFERAAPESREKALAREGLVIIVRRPAPVLAPAPPLVPGQRFLERLDVGPEVRARFAVAVNALAAGGAGAAEKDDGAAGDRARSAAERFLFDLLEALPDTRGLFQLNAPLPFRFGLKTAEADLLAADLRLVVEVDGYRHFTDAEGYRRDQRKDFLLQSEGYLVLRVLADDVVARLEDILAEVREAAALQRCRGHGGERQG